MKYFVRLVLAVALSLPLIFSLNACTGNEGNESMQSPESGATKSAAIPADAISGEVKETFNSGGYTYINVDSKGESVWVAVPEINVKVGDTVNLLNGTVMENFKSNTLKRTFDKIIFSLGPVGEGEMLSQGEVKETETLPVGPIKVEKATGKNAYTVAEVYEKRKELDSKTVKVKGKAVKVLREIMGKNWVHLQDGTGDSAKGTHDLVVTTKNVPQTGDVVVAEGAVASDKDFGSGYEYNVILEDANIEKK